MRNQFLVATLAAALGLVSTLALGQAVGPKAGNERSPLSTAEVVANLVQMNAARRAALLAYTSRRHYHVVFDGLGGGEADMEVHVAYRAPGPEVLTLLSEGGSKMLQHRVLDPLFKQEQQGGEVRNERRRAISPGNYTFAMVDWPHPGTQPDYVLEVTPRRRAQYLFVGKIWIEPVDFAVVRIEGKPDRSPSWWVSETDFSFRNQKVGEFWLPAESHYVSHVRIFGDARLTIDYGDYQILSALPVR